MTSNHRPAFSLLELIVVLVIVALISAMVVVQWSGVYHKAMLEQAVERMGFIDGQLRRHARTHCRACALSLDFRNNRLRKLYHGKSRQNPAWEVLGRGVELKKIYVAEQGSHKSKVDVLYFSDGTTRTFALHLLAPGDKQTWLLLAGVSGQVIRYDDESEFHQAWKGLTVPQQASL